MGWIVYVRQDGTEPKAFATTRTRERARELQEQLQGIINYRDRHRWEIYVEEAPVVPVSWSTADAGSS